MNLLKQEFIALLKDKKLLISVIAILFIPIMYSGMLIWSFWDPYGSLKNLPVAIINNDTGAKMNGKQIEMGKEFVKNLKESKKFNFYFVDHKRGYDNLNNQKYYLLVEIPKDFSKNATTLMNDHPKKLELKYVANEGSNFLSSQIGGRAIQEIKAELSKKITETYAKTTFHSMKKMADGYQSADKASGKLKNGILKLDSGTKTIEEKLALLAKKQLEFTDGTWKVQKGTASLHNGATSLSVGLGQLSNAQGQLTAGAQKVENGGSSLQTGIQQSVSGISTVQEKMKDVVSGTEKIHDGSVQLSDSLQKLKAGASSTTNGASQLKNGVTALESQLKPYIDSMPKDKQAELQQTLAQISAGSVQLEDGNKALLNSVSQIETGATNLSDQLASLNNGQKALQTGISKLYDGTKQLETGASQLQAGQHQLYGGLVTFGTKLSDATAGSQKLAGGSTTLANGVNQLTLGSTALANGSSQLANGSKKLVDGTTQLVKGSTDFKSRMNQAAQDSAKLQHANNDNYNMFAAPVQVENDSINQVPNYGTGIAPYFLSLGLFVGALVSSIVFPFREPAGVPKNGVSWFASKWVMVMLISLLQALIASFIILEVINIQVQNVPLFILFTVITSFSFMALIQVLVTTLENPGRFIAIMILILQLTSSAGTFPSELTPKTLQVLNHWLPMAYSVRGFREVISNGNFHFMWQNVFVLLGYSIVFMALTLLYFSVKHKKSYSRVSEEVMD